MISCRREQCSASSLSTGTCGTSRGSDSLRGESGAWGWSMGGGGVGGRGGRLWGSSSSFSNIGVMSVSIIRE